MDLKVYDESLARKQKKGNPSVHINFNVGIFTFGQASMKLMEISAGDQVKIGMDKKTKDWYVWKVSKGGFVLRTKKSEKRGGYALMFNNAATSEDIATETKFKGDSSIIPIGSEPVNEGGPDYIDYWPLITAALK